MSKGIPTDDSGGYLVPWSIARQIAEDVARLPLLTYRPSGYVYKPPTLRQRVRYAVATWRQRIGFAIAGYTPSEFDD